MIRGCYCDFCFVNVQYSIRQGLHNYDYDRLNGIVEQSCEDMRNAEKKEDVLYGYDVLGQHVFHVGLEVDLLLNLQKSNQYH